MESKEIKMPDGRYLIYFTFEDEVATIELTPENREINELGVQEEEGERV